MTQSLVRVGRLALLLAVGFVFGAAALSFATATSAKELFQHFSFSSNNGHVADASCDIPKAASDDVYFVSCGGFF